MVYGGMSSKKGGVVAFCRTDDFYKLFLASKDGEIAERNDWETLSLIECKKETPLQNSLPHHLIVITKVRDQFETEANEREVKKLDYLELVKRQIIDKLVKTKRSKTEKFKNEVDGVIDMVREAKLSAVQKRELRGVRSRFGLFPEELVDKVKKVIANSPKEDVRKIQKKYAEIIISESLV